MDDLIRHPDDATLFDLLDGGLDPAREQEVRLHLSRCAACAAFVSAARAGAPETTTAVVQMPSVASDRLHLRMREGWRERMERIGAAEQRESPSPGRRRTLRSPQGSSRSSDLAGAPALAPAARPAPRPWRRRLVPVLAFGVLAALAGTSVWVVDEAPAPRQGGADGESGSVVTEPGAGSDEASELASVPDIAADTATAPSAGGPAASTGAPPPADGTPVDDPNVDGRTVPADRVGPEAEVAEPPGGAEQFSDGTICVLTFDETAIELPDERIPQQVLEGPLGLLLVCG